MEISGKILQVFPMRSGTSSKGEWKSYSFLLETGGEYPKKILFSVFGEERWNKMGIIVGGTYQVSFDVDAREYKGKWYNDVSAWRAVRADGNGANATTTTQAPKSPVPNAQPAPQGANNEGGDINQENLPF